MKTIAGVVGACVGVLVLLAAGEARAQIVNVQSAIGEVPEGVSGQLDGTIDYRKGNVDLLFLGGAGTLRFRSGANLVFGVVRAEYGEFGEDAAPIIKHTFEHVRFRHTLSAKLTLEAFVQHEFDEFRRLELRALFGAGARLTLINQPRTALIVGAAYMFEREELDDTGMAAVTDNAEIKNNHRLSAYAIFNHNINDKVMLAETVYAQPLITDPGDIRVLSESGLEVKLTTRFGFKTALVVAFDSDPAQTLEGTDVALKSTVTYKF